MPHYECRGEETNGNATVEVLNAHIAIHVQDFTNNCDFYRNCSIEPCKAAPGYAKFAVANRAAHFTLERTTQASAAICRTWVIQVFASTAEVMTCANAARERSFSLVTK